jgi:hypothetical protein
MRKKNPKKETTQVTINRNGKISEGIMGNLLYSAVKVKYFSERQFK